MDCNSSAEINRQLIFMEFLYRGAHFLYHFYTALDKLAASKNREEAVMDVLYISLTVIFFVISGWLFSFLKNL